MRKLFGTSFLPQLLATWLLVDNPEYFFCQTRASGGLPGSTHQLTRIIRECEEI